MQFASLNLAVMSLPVSRYMPLMVISVPPATGPSLGLNPVITGSYQRPQHVIILYILVFQVYEMKCMVKQINTSIRYILTMNLGSN